MALVAHCHVLTKCAESCWFLVSYLPRLYCSLLFLAALFRPFDYTLLIYWSLSQIDLVTAIQPCFQPWTELWSAFCADLSAWSDRAIRKLRRHVRHIGRLLPGAQQHTTRFVNHLTTFWLQANGKRIYFFLVRVAWQIICWSFFLHLTLTRQVNVYFPLFLLGCCLMTCVAVGVWQDRQLRSQEKTKKMQWMNRALEVKEVIVNCPSGHVAFPQRWFSKISLRSSFAQSAHNAPWMPEVIFTYDLLKDKVLEHRFRIMRFITQDTVEHLRHLLEGQRMVPEIENLILEYVVPAQGAIQSIQAFPLAKHFRNYLFRFSKCIVVWENVDPVDDGFLQVFFPSIFPEKST